ncbi:PH domain-containing protein [Streptomyces sp. enrichment culture]|uniref:PH domain-containing protein n=1 Tax=Streptomyces sp. enrichment culture TaxID=1795815 RepID=UPI003F5530F0
MSGSEGVVCRSRWAGTSWFLAGLGAAGAVAAMVLAVVTATVVVPWLVAALLCAAGAVTALHRATGQVRADAHGLYIGSVLRGRTVPWSDVADLQVRLKYANTPRIQDVRRTVLVHQDGRKRVLPLPIGVTEHDPYFDDTLEALRALHRRHGTPGSDHLPVLSHRTAGRNWAGSLFFCVLLLAGAGVAGWAVPQARSHHADWRSAAPCPASAGAPRDGDDCLHTLTARIERTDPNHPRKGSHLYFADDRPTDRIRVSETAAEEFRAGDRVELTLWRGTVMKVAGERHVWQSHVTGGGDVAVLAAALALAAGYPAARIVLRVRARHRPDDEVLPSATPFVVALLVTAVWLLPLSYVRTTAAITPPTALARAGAGGLASLALLAWAWRSTRARARNRTPGDPVTSDAGREEFVRARFLEATDYNPHHFGTHVVVGGGEPPAVVPHPGPGRFAARPIPVHRLTVKTVRRARGGDGETVPHDWHVAELDDAGAPVHLTAAPADLPRILRHLTPAEAPAATPPDGPTAPAATAAGPDAAGETPGRT